VFDLRFSGIFALTAFLLSFLIGLVSRANMPILILRPLIFAVIFFALAAFTKILIGKFLPELLEDNMEEDVFSPGSRINILEGDSPADSSTMAEGFISGALGGQASSGAKPDDSEDGLGDISELSRRSYFSPSVGEKVPAGESISGIDQNAKERYTDDVGLGGAPVPDFSNMFSPDPSFAAPAGGQAKASGTGGGMGPGTVASVGPKTESAFSSDDTLPDLDSMAEAFMSDSSNEEQGATAEYSAPSSPRRPASSSKKAPEWTQDFNAKDIAMGIRTALSKDKEG